jgi:hypothetical protein
MSLGRSRVAVGLLIVLALGVGGCAVIMQQPPRQDRARGEVPVCSTSRGGVALDGALAALLGAGALAALAADEPGVALGVGAVGGFYTWSAVTIDYKMELAARAPRQQQQQKQQQPAMAGGGGERPLGPPIEQAAAPVEEAEAAAEEAPPPAEKPPPAPAALPPPAPGDWSDFWIEVAK